MSDISDAIRLKEQELSKMHEIRILRLENMIKQRDEELITYKKKLEHLKDDFQFNLNIVEERDKEVLRLDTLLTKYASELELKEKQTKSLTLQLSRYTTLEKQNKEKDKLEKASTKTLMKEMYEEIESVRWAMTEELKAKSTEIDALKSDLQRTHTSREQALEKQRQELSETFEDVLKQREDNIQEREQAINKQVVNLESRFDKLQTENSKLRVEINTYKRKTEQLSMEAAQGEETRRSLQWQLQDLVNEKERIIVESSDRIEELTSQLQLLRDDCTLRENRLGKELNDAKSANATDRGRIKELERNCSEIEYRLQDEIESKKSLRKDREAAQLKTKEIQEELEERVKEISRLTRLIATHEADTEEKNSKLILLEDDLTETRRQLSSANERIALIKEESVALNIGNEKLLSQLQQRGEMLQKAQLESSEYKSRIDNMNEEHQKLQVQLNDEHAEIEGLRLRLKVQSDMNSQQINKVTSALKAGAAEVERHRDGDKDGVRNSIGLDSVASPMFSEDFGPVSLPSSPVSPVPLSRHVLEERRQLQGQEVMSSMGDASAFEAGNLGNRSVDDLAKENEWLKDVIRSMRTDLETLRAAQSPVPRKKLSEKSEIANDVEEETPIPSIDDAMTSKTKTTNQTQEQGTERINLLETRLVQSTEEIIRLRAERKRLMDIGNEMRSALNRQRREILHDAVRASSDIFVPNSLRDAIQSRQASSKSNRNLADHMSYTEEEEVAKAEARRLETPHERAEALAALLPPPPPTPPMEASDQETEFDPMQSMAIIGRGASSEVENDETGGVYGTAASAQSQPVRNSDRTTLSQLRVLRRIKQKVDANRGVGLTRRSMSRGTTGNTGAGTATNITQVQSTLSTGLTQTRSRVMNYAEAKRVEESKGTEEER